MQEYIEDTLLSIIGQDYDNFEIIVMDGGSTDNTLEILRKYDKNIKLLVSEADAGQYDAINKGFRYASGDIYAWLNADDKYFPWTLSTVARVFSSYPSINWIRGVSSFIDQYGQLLYINDVCGAPRKLIQMGWFQKGILGYLQQESMFWRASLWDRAGGLNIEYKLAADFDLWIRFAESSDLVTVGIPLAAFRKRISSRSKVNMKSYEREVESITSQLKSSKILSELLTHSIIQHGLRFLIWWRSYIYFYSVVGEKWVCEKRLCSTSGMSISRAILETKLS